MFIPMVVTMWVIVGVLVYIQRLGEMEIRKERVSKELNSAAIDILSYYEENENPRSYLTFFSEFVSGTTLQRARISVYERDRLCYTHGTSIPLKYASLPEQEADKSTLYVSRRSNNGEIVVITSLPMEDIVNASNRSTTFWVVVCLLLVLCAVVSYLSTGYLTSNLMLLRKFAVQAARGEPDFDRSKFSHDELGDIFREIVKLYNDKTSALAATTREHEMAMFAVEEKSRIKRQLTNNINHEIKTPVGVIRGYLDTVLSSPDMDENTRLQFLGRAHSNVLRLCNLLNDVSTMTRLEESGANVNTTEVDFHDLVFGVYTDLSASGELKNMEFDSYIPLDCMVRGNTNLLTGVVSNLIRNAVQYSHGTKIELRFLVESEKFYTFSFADNGRGVEEEHIPHLFERFYRVDAGRSRKAGGTGLGLPIVKNAIEALGGSISVHNRTSGGLEFLFTLEKWNA